MRAVLKILILMDNTIITSFPQWAAKQAELNDGGGSALDGAGSSADVDGASEAPVAAGGCPTIRFIVLCVAFINVCVVAALRLGLLDRALVIEKLELLGITDVPGL